MSLYCTEAIPTDAGKGSGSTFMDNHFLPQDSAATLCNPDLWYLQKNL